jgi:hypothetical protein
MTFNGSSTTSCLARRTGGKVHLPFVSRCCGTIGLRSASARRTPTPRLPSKYRRFYLEAANGRVPVDQPAQEAKVSYQSDSWDDEGAHFNWTFEQPTELIGSSQEVLYMSCDGLDDMDLYVILRKLDTDGNALLNFNIPFEHHPAGVTEKDISGVNIYKYVGPNGRLRASKRTTAGEPDTPRTSGAAASQRSYSSRTTSRRRLHPAKWLSCGSHCGRGVLPLRRGRR